MSTKPIGCNCDDGFFLRGLEDPQCHYHSDYGCDIRDENNRLRELLKRMIECDHALKWYELAQEANAALEGK